ncbi:MAG: hypothetical protein AAFW82_09855 [Pseudomonadota bacterium]
MNIKHHPDVSTLITCAAGSQPEALCAVVTSHLSLCQVCMQELTRMEKIGVAVFEQLKQDMPSPNTHRAVINAIDCGDTPKADYQYDPIIPHPLRAILDIKLCDVPWEKQMPGVSSYALAMSPNATGDLKLIKLEAGVVMPAVNYTGEAMLLVIEGGGIFQNAPLIRGDYLEFCDGEIPLIEAARDFGCILLFAQEGVVN